MHVFVLRLLAEPYLRQGKEDSRPRPQKIKISTKFGPQIFILGFYYALKKLLSFLYEV